MGSTNISQLEFGYTATHAYEKARALAKQLHGDNPYSGTIGSSHGMRQVEIPEVTSNEALQRESDNINTMYRWVLDELYTSGIEARILDTYDKFDGVACINLGWHEWHLNVVAVNKCQTPEPLIHRFGLYQYKGQTCLEYQRALNDILINEAKRQAKQTGGLMEIWQLDDRNEKIRRIMEITVTTEVVASGLKGARPYNVYWFCGWVSI
jgi:hypothetical protein